MATGIGVQYLKPTGHGRSVLEKKDNQPSPLSLGTSPLGGKVKKSSKNVKNQT